MDKSSLEALLTSLDHWAAFFTLLVVIGVGGELIVHLLYSRASGRLISIQNSEDKERQAEIAHLGNQTAEANKTAAQVNEHAKLLEVQTEELRKQNLELQRRINPRFLTAAEGQTILKGIHPYSGHPIIFARLGDGEAGSYGDSIISAFTKARWRVQVNAIGIFVPPTYGVVCRISTKPDDAVKAAVASLQRAGINIITQEVDGQQNSWIDVMVALKPVT